MSLKAVKLKAIDHVMIRDAEIQHGKAKSLLAKNEIEFKPYGGNAIECIELLPINDKLAISQFKLLPGPRILIERENQLLNLRLKGKPSSISIEVGSKFKMRLQGCELFCRGKSMLRVPLDKTEVIFVELPSFNQSLQFQTFEELSSFALHLEDALLENSKPIKIFDEVHGIELISSFEKNPTFSVDGRFASKDDRQYLEQGHYRMRGNDSEFDLPPFRANPNSFRKMKVALVDDQFLLNFEGKYSSFEIEQNDEFIEKIPSYLSWFRTEKKDYAIILSVLLALSGLILSTIDVFEK